jgi:hypothetical protein
MTAKPTVIQTRIGDIPSVMLLKFERTSTKNAPNENRGAKKETAIPVYPIIFKIVGAGIIRGARFRLVKEMPKTWIANPRKTIPQRT